MSKNTKFWVLVLGILVLIGALVSVTTVNVLVKEKENAAAVQASQQKATTTTTLETGVSVQTSY